MTTGTTLWPTLIDGSTVIDLHDVW